MQNLLIISNKPSTSDNRSPVLQISATERARLQVCVGRAECRYVPVVEVPLDAGHLAAGYVDTTKAHLTSQ